MDNASIPGPHGNLTRADIRECRMDAGPVLSSVARALRDNGLEAILIGNAAAALQGARNDSGPGLSLPQDSSQLTKAQRRGARSRRRYFEAVLSSIRFFSHDPRRGLFAD